jgi:voltage-gated potassium channel Kch
LFLSLKDSLKDMLVLVLMLLAMAVLFANLMFYAEFDSLTFPNMFQGIWYAIVTMTTVGYGDIFPVSTLGCIVGSVCALSGIFIMAIPIAIMAGNLMVVKFLTKLSLDALKKNLRFTKYLDFSVF